MGANHEIVSAMQNNCGVRHMEEHVWRGHD